MTRRGRQPDPAPIRVDCACGTPSTAAQVCCQRCWRRLPEELRAAWLRARGGGWESAEARETAAGAIREHLAEAGAG
jgi:hypothetical protein